VQGLDLKRWLLSYKGASESLRQALGALANWLANADVPWARYRALMSSRLVAIDKNPGVRPVGIGDAICRFIAKCVLEVTKGEAVLACGSDQLCAGLQNGCEAGIHAMRKLFEDMKQEEFWGFLLIDARNAFNEGNRIVMLYVVRHMWPSGARFCMNCYKYWPILILRDRNGTTLRIFSKEGVTQGDPIAMFMYGIGIVPMIRKMKELRPNFRDSWYADDGAGQGNFVEIREYLDTLAVVGKAYNYYPKHQKSTVVVREKELEAANSYFADMQTQVVTGACYLGGFVGDNIPLTKWLLEKMKVWVHKAEGLAKAAEKYPQSSYCAMTRSLINELQYVQRTIPGIGPAFAAFDDVLKEDFIPALFGEPKEALLNAVSDGRTSNRNNDPRLRLAPLPVKMGGLAISYPLKTASHNFLTSTLTSSHLQGAILGTHQFCFLDHMKGMKDNHEKTQLKLEKEYKSTLKEVLSTLTPLQKRCIEIGKLNGSWLQVYPSVFNGTCLSKNEFRDTLLARYGKVAHDHPAKCDGCGEKFSVQHALSCKIGGLVWYRHEEVKIELIHLAKRAMTGMGAVQNEPEIFPRGSGGASTANNNSAEKDGN